MWSRPGHQNIILGRPSPARNGQKRLCRLRAIEGHSFAAALGFSSGGAALTLKKPPPLVPICLMATRGDREPFRRNAISTIHEVGPSWHHVCDRARARPANLSDPWLPNSVPHPNSWTEPGAAHAIPVRSAGTLRSGPCPAAVSSW